MRSVLSYVFLKFWNLILELSLSLFPFFFGEFDLVVGFDFDFQFDCLLFDWREMAGEGRLFAC